jgi:L-threonylcarbamoyladenylate synthase
VNWEQNQRIRIAARLLRNGEVIAYPTEAVWGLGCDPLNQSAVARILALKGRAQSKGLILIAASAAQILPYLGRLCDGDVDRLTAPRAVPTTWVVPAARQVPQWLTGGRETLAVRITTHPMAAALCRVFGGPLVSTSANPQGKPPAKTAFKVRQYFRDAPVCIVPGALGGAVKPSEIRDLRNGSILRPGE